MPFDDVLRRSAPCDRTVPGPHDAGLTVILDERLRARIATSVAATATWPAMNVSFIASTGALIDRFARCRLP
ncbi:hypothetical protein WS54_12365 [Burkholderia sp. NRF60-BP8]|nr:hypothetical protein WS54_12365 [Burkholderia sp. NRF60-BP8]